MISDNDKKRVKDIVDGLKSIEANLDNLSFAYKIAGKLFGLCDSLEDKDLKFNLKGELARIMQTQYKKEIQQATKSIFSFIDETKREVKEINKKYIDVKQENVSRSERYKADCRKYSSLEENIEKLEEKIIRAPEYVENLHKEITKQKSKWFGYLHARLTKNLRLMYLWNKEKRKLIFEAIITHDDYDF